MNMKLWSKILIVLAVVNITACRPPQKKNVEAKVEQNTSKDDLDPSGLKVFPEETTSTKGQDLTIRNPHGRVPLRSVDQALIEPTIGGRLKEIRRIRDVINIHNTPKGESMKKRLRRHRRSTGSRRGNLVKRGSNVYALAQVCDTSSPAPQDHLRLQQEDVKFRFGDESKFVPAGCKTMTTASKRVCRVSSEIPVTIQLDPPVEVFKRFCEDAGLNFGNGLRGGGDHICEQEYLNVTLADQQHIRVQSGCGLKFLWQIFNQKCNLKITVCLCYVIQSNVDVKHGRIKYISRSMYFLLAPNRGIHDFHRISWHNGVSLAKYILWLYFISISICTRNSWWLMN